MRALAAERPAVVLIHGWNGWPGNWQRIAGRLQAAGHAVFVPRLPIRPLRESVRADAMRLHDYLQQAVRDGRPLAEQPVVLCGYSRGGLVARAYVRQYGGDHVAGIVHVAVPHLGCPWGRLKLLRPLAGLAEMEEGSPLLRWLNADLSDLERIPQLAICGRANDWNGYNDLVVWEASATLGGRLPCACVDLLPATDAWHGNLINRAWIRVPLPHFGATDRCWPVTLRHLEQFLRTLGAAARGSADKLAIDDGEAGGSVADERQIEPEGSPADPCGPTGEPGCRARVPEHLHVHPQHLRSPFPCSRNDYT